MNKTDIEWADMTWNPVTGCRHGCNYCFANDFAHRFKGGGYTKDGHIIVCPYDLGENGLHVLTAPIYRKTKAGKIVKAAFPFGFEPTLHWYRLDEPARVKRPQNIFVVDMGDLFGEWVPVSWTDEVFQACDTAPWHKYLFLTKNPAGIERAIDNFACEDRGSEDCFTFFGNCWFGTSIAKSEDLHRVDTLVELEEGHRFISIEPFHGPIVLKLEKERCPVCNSRSGIYHQEPAVSEKPWYCEACGDWEGTNEHELKPSINWVIVGAQTGTGAAAHKPRREWVEAIVQQCRAADVPVFLKNNLADVWGGDLIQELPDELQTDEQERRCRVCGCTQNNACPGGCYWVEYDLCSRCAGKPE